MKKKYFIFPAALLIIITITIYTAINDAGVHANINGAPAGYTGSPGDGKDCSGCHSGNAVTSKDWITSDIPESGYVAGEEYTITVSASSDQFNRFGFQVSPQNTSGGLLGTLIATDAGTHLVGSGKYITHNLSGSAGNNNSKTWNFKWKAPSSGAGPVTFYGAINAANANGNVMGDFIFLSTLDVHEGQKVNIEQVASGEPEFKVFPTFLTDRLNIHFNIQEASEANLEIFDLSGRLVMRRNYGFQTAGKQEILVDCSAFPSGTLLVVLSLDGQKMVRKVIK